MGAAAFAGATLQPYLADRALVHIKLDIARTAANAIDQSHVVVLALEEFGMYFLP